MDKVDLTKAQIDIETNIEKKAGFIIATLGRACKSSETLIAMIDAGMNIVRLRLCQGERKKQVIMLEYLKEAFVHKPHKKCYFMVDIRGRDITIGAFEDGAPYIDIESGEDIELLL